MSPFDGFSVRLSLPDLSGEIGKIVEFCNNWRRDLKLVKRPGMG